MSLEFSLVLSYKRKRPNTQGDKWEARVDSAGLMVIGAVVVVIVLVLIIPRILSLL